MRDQAKIGLVSVTFRQLTPGQVIAAACKAGLKGIEWGGDIHVPAGDLKKAKEVGEATRAAGLEVTSYGSYFGITPEGCDWEELERVLDTAEALKTDVVRVWLKNGASSADTSEDDYQRILPLCRETARRAAARNLTVCLEFHNGTYNDGGEVSARMMKDVGAANFRTYWQPLYSTERNARDIQAVLPYIVHTHIYHWIYGEKIQRLPLRENREGLVRLAGLLGKRWYLLEFVRNDDPAALCEDAEAMREILRDAGLGES